MKRNLSRRAVLKALSLGAAAAAARPGRGAEARGLSTEDTAAQALGYVENAAQVDPGKYPSYVQGNNCENCLQLQGEPGSPYRPCSLFPGKLVAIRGWCSGWTAEM